MLQEDPAILINQQTCKIGQSIKEQLQGSSQVEIHIFLKISL